MFYCAFCFLINVVRTCLFATSESYRAFVQWVVTARGAGGADICLENIQMPESCDDVTVPAAEWPVVCPLASSAVCYWHVRRGCIELVVMNGRSCKWNADRTGFCAVGPANKRLTTVGWKLQEYRVYAAHDMQPKLFLPFKIVVCCILFVFGTHWRLAQTHSLSEHLDAVFLWNLVDKNISLFL